MEAKKKDNSVLIGNRLKALRRDLELSQREFAAIMDISASFLSEVESGKTKPGFNFILLLYEKFNISPSWFLVEEGEKFVGEDSRNAVKDLDFGGQTDDVLEMLRYMSQSPFVQSTVLSSFMKFLYENEDIIKKDIAKNKKQKLINKINLP
jgi:transcriptional regulator with XRE-family HTH domain